MERNEKRLAFAETSFMVNPTASLFAEVHGLKDGMVRLEPGRFVVQLPKKLSWMRCLVPEHWEGRRVDVEITNG